MIEKLPKGAQESPQCPLRHFFHRSMPLCHKTVSFVQISSLSSPENNDDIYKGRKVSTKALIKHRPDDVVDGLFLPSPSSFVVFFEGSHLSKTKKETKDKRFARETNLITFSPSYESLFSSLMALQSNECSHSWLSSS